MNNNNNNKLAKFINFVWKALKFKVFIFDKILPPYIIFGDWTSSLIKLVSLAFPNTYF